MSLQDGATDTTYIVSNYEEEDGGETPSSSENSSARNGKLDTYLDERIDIPDANNVSMIAYANLSHLCLFVFAC